MASSIQPLLLLGTHHFAPEALDLIGDIDGFRVDGFVENVDRSRVEEAIEGLPVYWIDEIEELVQTHRAVCVLGTTKRSRFIDDAHARGLSFATAIHPSAHISPRSTLGEGTFVSANVFVAARTTIGRHGGPQSQRDRRS